MLLHNLCHFLKSTYLSDLPNAISSDVKLPISASARESTADTTHTNSLWPGSAATIAQQLKQNRAGMLIQDILKLVPIQQQ
jgi:hypothetical protein